MLTNGTVIHGRYRIAREIGHGGMGAVYEALDSRLQNTVAVKECRLPGVDANRAFEREAKLLASLRHPALPVVIDYFIDGEAQYLVMQFIEGDDLGKLLDHRRSRFPPAEVVVWAGTVLDALSYLHDHEPPVVHRDIKPANLKRTPRGEIVLLDFGLAKGRPEDPSTPPPDRSVFGYTLAYAPLEQILGRKTDARSDVYAVGATLYHLLTGYPPANARDRSRAVASGTADPLPAAHLAGADIPENLGRLIARAMALDGSDRYESARSMRAALNECGVDQTTHVNTPEHDGASRRIDVAAPSRAEVGRQIDVLVQVRFETSTRLGLEDWPSKARPDEIEQVSEAVQLAYPTDPQTGHFLPARIRIKLIAPDFRVDGQADRLIEVPPEEYSKRLAFLLTPLRAGSCRINVEAYGVDDLFLGAVPVEIMAVAGAVSVQEISVGNLVLEVVARQVAALLLGARIAAAPSPASLAADAGSSAISMADAGSSAISMAGGPAVPVVERSASLPSAAAPGAARASDTETYGQPMLRGAKEEASPKRRLSHVARVTAPLAVIVFAVAVLLTMRGVRETPAPTVAAPASAPVQAPETKAPAPAAALPVPLVPMEPPSATTAKSLIAQGNLVGAARTIVGGLKENPNNSDLIGTLQQVYGAAEAEATQARKAADAVGVKDRPEYADANARFKSAVSAGASDRSEDKASAVEQYVTAAQRYISAVNSHALMTFKQGNLNGAARVLAAGLAAAPGHADLRKTLQEILDAAETEATAAKRSADVVAGASSRSEYVNATSQFRSASNSRSSGRPENAEAAVREFGAAEKLYKEAAATASPPPPPPPVGAGPVVNRAKGLIALGNLTGAARTVVEGLNDYPKNSELLGTLDSIYDTAESEATNARRAAEAAGAKDRPEYGDANERLQRARNSVRTVGPQNAESIVREFGTAAELYRTAAARVKTAPGSDPRVVDELAIRKLLADYVDAYNSMDARRVRRFKPAFSGFHTDLSSTELTIKDIRIVLSLDRQTATVTLTAQYRNTYRKGAMADATAPPVPKLTWRAQRKGDDWILLD